MLADRVNRIHVSPTMQIASEAKRMRAEGINIIDLSVGEPDFPTPHNIKEAGKTAIEENHTKYTINSGTIELRKAISAKLKRDNGLNYSLNEIIVSNGVKQAVFNTIFSLIGKDDEVIIPAPYWVSYPDMVNLAGGKPVIVPAAEQNGFRITADQLEKAISPKTKLFILCNPSNPTGSAYNKEQLNELAEVLKKKDIFILSDEIYEKLIYDGFRFISFPSLSDDLKRKTILVNGVSKAYSMTGWRIGYAAAEEVVIEAMNKIQSHTTSHASSISQFATIEALTGPQYVIDEMLDQFNKRREYLYTELTSIEGISCYNPEGAFFLFPNVSHYFNRSTDVFEIKNSFDFAMHLLYEAKIAVVPGSAFGAKNNLRISYATSMENLIEAVKRFKEMIGKLK